MQLSDDDLKEFIEIWKAEFGEEISIAYARERASQVLELFWMLSQHVGREEAGLPPPPSWKWEPNPNPRHRKKKPPSIVPPAA